MSSAVAYTGDVILDDEFMLNEFKVTMCDRGFRHNWRRCPFAHEDETARRRDPKIFKYRAVVCPQAKKKEECPRGVKCPAAHNAFEYWLLPSRYKTEMCKLGSKAACKSKRPFCFFAHSKEELGPILDDSEDMSLEMDADANGVLPTRPISAAETHGKNNCQHWNISDFFEEWDLEKMNISRKNDRAAKRKKTKQGTLGNGVVFSTSFLDKKIGCRGNCSHSGACSQQDSGIFDNSLKDHSQLPSIVRFYDRRDEAAAYMNNTNSILTSPYQTGRNFDGLSTAGRHQLGSGEEFPSMRILKILSSNMKQKPA